MPALLPVPVSVSVWRQAVSKGQQPGSWFLQLPRYPRNLRQWLQQLAGEAAGERSRRVTAVLRPLLQGLAYLHQVRDAAWPDVCCRP